MSTAALRHRLNKLEQKLKPLDVSMNGTTLPKFEAAIRQSGVMDRLGHIAEHGASPDDLEWLEERTRETGVDFAGVVEMLVRLEDEC